MGGARVSPKNPKRGGAGWVQGRAGTSTPARALTRGVGPARVEVQLVAGQAADAAVFVCLHHLQQWRECCGAGQHRQQVGSEAAAPPPVGSAASRSSGGSVRPPIPNPVQSPLHPPSPAAPSRCPHRRCRCSPRHPPPLAGHRWFAAGPRPPGRLQCRRWPLLCPARRRQGAPATASTGLSCQPCIRRDSSDPLSAAQAVLWCYHRNTQPQPPPGGWVPINHAPRLSLPHTLRKAAAWISCLGIAPPNRSSTMAASTALATSDDMMAAPGGAARRRAAGAGRGGASAAAGRQQAAAAAVPAAQCQPQGK